MILDPEIFYMISFLSMWLLLSQKMKQKQAHTCGVGMIRSKNPTEPFN